MDYSNVAVAIVSGTCIWFCCGTRTFVRVVVAGLGCAMLLGFAFAWFVPCDGFGQGFRLFFDVECQ
jgi:hypothetical protein